MSDGESAERGLSEARRASRLHKARANAALDYPTLTDLGAQGMIREGLTARFDDDGWSSTGSSMPVRVEAMTRVLPLAARRREEVCTL